MSSRTKSLASDTVLFTIGSVGVRLITFILVPIYTNCLTTEELGYADLIVTLAQLLYPIASLTIHDALLRFGISKYYERKVVITNAFLLCGISALIIIIVSPFFWFYRPVSNWTPYIGIIAILSLFNINLLNTLKTQNRNRLYVLANIVYISVLLIMNLTMTLGLKLKVEGYLLSQIIALAVSIVILSIFTKLPKNVSVKLYDKILIKEMIKYSAPLTINNISWWGMNSAGKVIVETFASASSLGLYTVASKLPALQSVFTSAFSQAWTLSAVKEYERSNDELYYTKVFNYYSLLLTLLNACILIVLEPLLSLFIGNSFLECGEFVPSLLFGNIFYSYALFFSSFYAAAKKNKAVTLVTLSGALTLIIVGIALTPFIGLWGTVIASVVGNIVYCISGYIGCKKVIKMKAKFQIFNTNVLISLVMTVATTVKVYSSIICGIGILVILLINCKNVKVIANKAYHVFVKTNKK